MIKYTGGGSSGVKINGVEVTTIAGPKGLVDAILKHEEGWQEVVPGVAVKEQGPEDPEPKKPARKKGSK